MITRRTPGPEKNLDLALGGQRRAQPAGHSGSGGVSSQRGVSAGSCSPHPALKQAARLFELSRAGLSFARWPLFS